MKTIRKVRKIATPILLLLFLAGITVLIIYYGRGYRIDLNKKTLETKGLMVANSQPDGAQIFIDGKLISATNTTVNLAPGWYTVRLEKEGYSSWEKKLRIQGEVVAKTDAILFPINPSLSPITVTGVTNPTLSPDNSKIVFYVSKNNNNIQETLDTSGVYVMDLNDRPLGATRNARQIAKNLPVSFEKAKYFWDPTSKKVLAEIGARYFLLDATLLNSAPQDVTAILTTLETEWKNEETALETERLGSLKPRLGEILKTTAKIIAWSPDETKILYEATASAQIPPITENPLIGTNPTGEERSIKPDQIYVYDIKEDKNFFITEKSKIFKPSPSPTTITKSITKQPSQESQGFENWKLKIGNSEALPLLWFPTSSHLLLTQENKILVMDYDATNKITLYAGPFTGNLVAPWPNGSKIVILTTLNPQPDAQPNLYAINIR